MGASPSDLYSYPIRPLDGPVELLSSMELELEQDSDEAIGKVKQEIRAGKWPCSIQTTQQEIALFLATKGKAPTQKWSSVPEDNEANWKTSVSVGTSRRVLVFSAQAVA